MNLNQKVIYGLERISDAFKVLLWDQAKRLGISPIQIQILLFLTHHRTELCNVTHLAREFHVTKPTVSDAIRVLIKKEYLAKVRSDQDSRIHTIVVTNQGKSLIDQLADYNLPVHTALSETSEEGLADLFATISIVIDNLYRQGVIQVQRSCRTCRFFQAESGEYHCELLGKNLFEVELRLDCPEHETQA